MLPAGQALNNFVPQPITREKLHQLGEFKRYAKCWATKSSCQLIFFK
jgi:hypothetical protein